MKKLDYDYHVTPLKKYESFHVGDLVSLHDDFLHEDDNDTEPEPWDPGTFGVILEISSIAEENHQHYEIKILAKGGETWTIDPTEIKEKL